MSEEKSLKKKIIKTCDNCAFLKHELCSKPGKKCSKWVNRKRTCINCEFAHSCILLGKNKPSCFGFCSSFKKTKDKNPINIFPDAEEYKAYKEERALRKEEKKKGKLAAKKDVGKIELLDSETPTPIKSPKVKIAKKKKELDPTLQDKDRADWSPMDKIEEIVSRNYDPEAFALVDERDLPKSDNIIRFILEPEFLNQPLYPRQLQICLDFFGAYCPYCSDTNWIRNKIEVDEKVENILDKAVLYSDGVCPKCGKSKYDAVKEGAHTLYTSLNLAVGQRSGKTSLIWMISPAIIHEYLQIPNPAKFMRQLDVTEFHATFVGVTAEDAYKNVWSPMDNVFTWSPWYRMYHQFLDEEGKRIGTELYKHLDTFITYHHKGIYASSGNADFRKLRGKTRIIGGMDEPSYMTGDKIVMNAWQAYDALNNSLSTLQTAHGKIFSRFPWAPTAYGLYTSSTRSKQDFIMGMHKRARRVPSIYSKKMATWEFNPNMPRDCEFIKSKYLEDYAAAERDYASNPPFASDPYIRKASMIVPILSKRSNVLSIDKIKVTRDSLGGKALYPTIKCIPHTYPCVLSVDAGYKKNSFAIALTHRIPVKDDPDSYLLATSGLLEIAPREGIPISYSKVYDEVICKIIEKFNVVLFATDQWQGIDLQSRVYNDFEIDALQYSVKYDDFELLRTNISSETWELPKLDGDLKEVLAMEKDLDELVFRKPVSHLMLQLLLSKDTGKSVVKNTDAGEDFTDDLLRAAVLGVSLIENEEYAHLFETEGRFGVYNGPMGAVASFAGGPGRTYVPGLGASAKFRT